MPYAFKKYYSKRRNLLSEKCPSFYHGRVKIMINQFSGIYSQFFLQQGDKLNAVVAEKVITIWVFPFSYNHCDKMNFESMRSFLLFVLLWIRAFHYPYQLHWIRNKNILLVCFRRYQCSAFKITITNIALHKYQMTIFTHIRNFP